jgi:gamma-glutamyltranspeptidase/glutathione hydrolase
VTGVERVGSRGAVVSTGSGPSTLAALAALGDGGNAFDAAVAASAVLMVTLPMASGLGGDLVAVGWDAERGEPFAFVACGPAPAGATPDGFRGRGLDRIPLTGILSLTLPGALYAHGVFAERLASRPLHELFDPAVRAAEDGVTVTEQLSRWIDNNLDVIGGDGSLIETYAPGGAAPAAGSTLRQPELGGTLRRLGELRPGEVDPALADAILECSRRLGGTIGADDVLEQHAEFVDPVRVGLGGHELLSSPLPTQGYLLLQNLRMLALHRELRGRLPADAEAHVLTEIVAQTFAQRLERAGDPREGHDAGELLEDSNLERLLARVDPERRSPCPYRAHYTTGDTTHFVIVDERGNAVSMIQSLGLGFGAGVAPPGTGLILGNRLGRSSTLTPGQLNCARPGRRPVNTIHTWLALEDGAPRLIGGTPGGDGQPQWSSQVLAPLLLDGERDLAGAAGAPRWTYFPGSDLWEAGRREHLQVDRRAGHELKRSLAARGHELVERRDVGGCVRIARMEGGCVELVDDGRQEGVSAAHETRKEHV